MVFVYHAVIFTSVNASRLKIANALNASSVLAHLKTAFSSNVLAAITTDLTSRDTAKYHLNDDGLVVTNLDQFSPHYYLLSGCQED